MNSKSEATKLSATKLILLIGSTLTVMAGATIAPSLPQIQETFKETPNIELLSRLVLTAPALFIALGSPLAGNLTDKIGRMPLLISGIILYTIAGSAPLLLNDVYWIIASRGLLGIGVAAIMTSLTTLIGDYYEGNELNQTLGLQGAFMAFGGFLFLIGGGLLADVGWRWPFAIYATAIIMLPFALKHLSEVSTTETEDNSKEDISLSSSLKWVIFLTYLLAAIDFIVFYMLPVHLPFYLRQLDVESNTLSGIALAALTLSGGIGSLFYRKVKSRMSYAAIYAMLFVLAFAGFLLLSFAQNIWVVIIAQIITGLGFGLFMPNANLFLVNTAPIRVRGRVVGGVTTAVFLGQFLSPIITNPLKEAVGIAVSFRVAAFALLGIALVFLINFLVKRRSATRVKEYSSGFDETKGELLES